MPKTYKCVITATRQQIAFLESFITTAFQIGYKYHLGDVEVHQDHLRRLPVKEIATEAELDPNFESLVFFVDAENRNNSFFAFVRENSIECCIAEYENDDWKNLIIYSKNKTPQFIRMQSKRSFNNYIESAAFRELDADRQESLIQCKKYMNDSIGELMAKNSYYETLEALAYISSDQ